MRLAFIGFRHGHILSLYAQAREHAQVQVVAACEQDAESAAAVKAAGKVALTHQRYDAMLDEVDCDAIAIGDCYGRRGELAIRALRAGKHVLSDKPLCTRWEEYEEIARLARDRQLQVGCMLDLRAIGAMRSARTAIVDDAIGPVHTVSFSAQHPLLPDTRPGWYFEPGMHGGTINDIGIHALDLIPWMTGRQIDSVVAARAWNARFPRHPHFQDAGQVMLKLDNGGGVLGDVSYLAPERCGYKVPQYWRITCHGSHGMIEVDGEHRVMIATNDDAAPRTLAAEADVPTLILDGFMRRIEGAGHDDDLTTQQVLTATRHALLAQQAADSAAAAAR